MSSPAVSILLVDADPDALPTLEQAGYAVVTPADADEALRLAAGTDFLIALVNYVPNNSAMDGLELLARLRDISPLTVCLLMTAHDRGIVGLRAGQAGAFNCLVKPLSDEVLLKAVREGLDERRRRECGSGFTPLTLEEMR